jgi:hypothetical protein
MSPALLKKIGLALLKPKGYVLKETVRDAGRVLKFLK